jgi:hypothetical protein
MTKPNHQSSQRVHSALEEIAGLVDTTQQHAMRAEDVLTSLEDREARRAIRSAATDPRVRIN